MLIMNDLEWPIPSYFAVYYEKFKNVMQRAEKVALILTWWNTFYQIKDASDPYVVDMAQIGPNSHKENSDNIT